MMMALTPWKKKGVGGEEVKGGGGRVNHQWKKEEGEMVILFPVTQ